MCTAPSSFPVNVSAEVIDSTTVMLRWKSPPSSDHNGVIRYYAVNLTELESASQFQQTVDTSPMVVSSLHPFYTYEVEVAAVTVAVGPYSLPVSFQLPEDGELWLYHSTEVDLLPCISLCVHST